MSAVDISSKMEILVPDDILRDMMEPGKVFQRRLEPRISQDENSQRPLASLVLEKMAGDVIKIIVSVNKPEASMESNSESSKSDVQQNEVSNSSQQTDNTETENRLMQTEKKCEKSQQQQTEKKDFQESGFQTTTAHFKEIGVQTTNKECVENAIQTDAKKLCDSHCQTVVKEFSETTSQTIIKEFREIQCQTLVKEYSEVLCQTVIKEFSEVPCQTMFSLANLRESECQATVVMCNGGSQTKVDMSSHGVQATTNNTDGASQTEILSSDSCVQTEKDEGVQHCQTELSMLFMFENASQTEIDSASCDSQTDSSFAFRGDFGCQMAPDMAELYVQTEPNPVRAVPSQTEIITQYAETQTTPDLSNRETQTDDLLTVTVDAPLPSAGVLEQNTDPTMPPPLESLSAEGDLILPSADIQSITPLAVVPMNQAEKKAVHAQTDPVTIIIGDASFLVERLKGSAVKTEKREREIEIEFAENGTADVKTKSRSGYIPGSGLHNPLGSPPLQGRIPREKLKSTPVQPFDPRTIKDIQLLRTPKGDSPKKPSPAVRKDPEKVTPSREAEPKLSDDSGDHVVKQELSCPFCDQTFLESSVLYQHITKMHNEKRKKTHYKPKGREGMTTTPRRPKFVPSDVDLADQMPEHVRASVEKYRQIAIAAGRTPPNQKVSRAKPKAKLNTSSPMVNAPDVGYQSPPVLEPVYMVDKVQLVGDDGQNFKPSPSGRTYKRQAPKIEAEPNLFEDLPEPKRAYPRGRVRREEEDEDTALAARAQMDAYEYECPHCPERYGSASHLYGHLKRSHKQELEQQRAQGESISDEGEEEPGRMAEPPASSNARSVQPQVADSAGEQGDEGSANEQYEVEEEAEGGEEEVEREREEVEADDDEAVVESDEEAGGGEAEPKGNEGEHFEGEEEDTGALEHGGEEEHGESEEYRSNLQAPVKRKRSSVGRPPKQKKHKMSGGTEDNQEQLEEQQPIVQAPKKKPGRPRKDSSKTPTPAEMAPVKKITRTRKPRTS